MEVYSKISTNSRRNELSFSRRKGISLTKNMSAQEQRSQSRPKCISLTASKRKNTDDRAIRLIVKGIDTM